MFARVVRDAVGDGEQPGDRRDVDDAARTLCEHDFPERLREQKRCDEINLENALELLDARIGRAPNESDPGVVHQHVDAPEPRRDQPD